MTHIITFGRQLNKQQKKCKTINVIISDKAKTLHFVGQMYKRDYFTEEQMTKYKILLDGNKVWDKALAHFTDLFSLRKAYGNDNAANSGFKSAAHTRDHSSACSVITANTERVISHMTSTLRAWRNHSQQLKSTVQQTQPHAHLYHPFLIPSRFNKPNSWSNASRYRKSWCRMQNSWQHSPRVAVVATAGAAAAAVAKAAAGTTAVGTKPHLKRKNSAPTA
jgi:hypothetical protein